MASTTILFLATQCRVVETASKGIDQKATMLGIQSILLRAIYSDRQMPVQMRVSMTRDGFSLRLFCPFETQTHVRRDRVGSHVHIRNQKKAKVQQMYHS